NGQLGGDPRGQRDGGDVGSKGGDNRRHVGGIDRRDEHRVGRDARGGITDHHAGEQAGGGGQVEGRGVCGINRVCRRRDRGVELRDGGASGNISPGHRLTHDQVGGRCSQVGDRLAVDSGVAGGGQVPGERGGGGEQDRGAEGQGHVVLSAGGGEGDRDLI